MGLVSGSRDTVGGACLRHKMVAASEDHDEKLVDLFILSHVYVHMSIRSQVAGLTGSHGPPDTGTRNLALVFGKSSKHS